MWFLQSRTWTIVHIEARAHGNYLLKAGPRNNLNPSSAHWVSTQLTWDFPSTHQSFVAINTLVHLEKIWKTVICLVLPNMLLGLRFCRQQAQLFLKDMQPVRQSYTFPVAGCIWLFPVACMPRLWITALQLKDGYCVLMVYLLVVLSLSFQIAALSFQYFWSEMCIWFLSDTSFLQWGGT